MTEADWVACTDPARMLEHLTRVRMAPAGMPARSRPREAPLASDRKLRLFACACARQVWGQLTDPRSRRAVEVAERYADGEVTQREAETAAGWAQPAEWLQPTWPFEVELACRCAGPIGSLLANSGLPRWFSVSTKLAADQAALLRCIFGDPWRPVELATEYKVVSVGGTAGPSRHERSGPSGKARMPYCPWLTWRDGTVPKIARAIYDDRRFEEMPILADALEEAGCDNEDMLQHCRGWERCPACLGERMRMVDFGIVNALMKCPDCNGSGWVPAPLHARGCWAIDLILGKE